MLSATHKPFMLSAIMLNVVMLGAVAPKAVTYHRQGEGIPSFKKIMNAEVLFSIHATSQQ